MDLKNWALAMLVCGAGGNAWAQGVAPADLFLQLDKNRDGKLVADEFSEGQFRFFERLIQIGDTNLDGAISIDEFKKALLRDSVPPAAPAEPVDEHSEGAVASGVITPKVKPQPSEKPVVQPEPTAGATATGQNLSDTQMPLSNATGTEESGGDRPVAELLFNQLDLNRDGKVSRDELPPRIQDRLSPVFDQLGLDSITLEQFKKVGSNSPRQGRRGRDGEGRPMRGRQHILDGNETPPAQHGAQQFSLRSILFMKLVDEDQNGKISKAELEKASEQFLLLDANGDGELDAAELIGVSLPVTLPQQKQAPAAGDAGDSFAPVK